MSNPTLYLTFILISQGLDRKRLEAWLRDADRDGAREFFLGCYSVCDGFFYNENLRREINRSYLGRIHVPDFDGLGAASLDLVLTSYEPLLQTRSLHVHVLLDDASKVLSFDEPRSVAAVAAAVRRLMYPRGGEPSSVHLIGQITDELRGCSEERRYTVPFTSYTYISLCDLSRQAFDDHLDRYAKELYALLYAHAEGVSPEVARSALDGRRWSSTDFAASYYQPGGMVTVSTGHPQAFYRQHRRWFLWPEASRGQEVVEFGEKPQVPLDVKLDPYNLLPEYPPLRYLGLASLEHSGLFEEGTRRNYDVLLRIHEHDSPFSLAASPFLNYRKLHAAESEYFRLNNLEYLRLPVTRGLVQSLIDEKLQQGLIDNIRDLKGRHLNTMVLVLTVVATVAAVVSLAPSCTGS